MADQEVEKETHDSAPESFIDKITEKFKGDDSSSSNSEDDQDLKTTAFAVKAKIYRLFGREKPVHKVLGGGKPADIFLWRDQKVSAGVLGLVTTIWVLFELVEYHLLTLVCHVSILGLAVVFLSSNASKFIKNFSHQDRTQWCFGRAPGHSIREEPEEIPCRVVYSIRILVFWVISGLWVLSVLGGCFNFLNLLYIGFVLSHTVPLLYEKYEDQVDSFTKRAEAELKKQYAVFNAKVLSKISKGALAANKFA